MSQKAIIIGAGPAGLTAAFEFQKLSDIQPIILEMSDEIGGISRTVNYKGNRMDIGGHRFFSKSDRVMRWWMDVMPIQKSDENDFSITYQNKSKKVETNNDAAPDADKVDIVMLIRGRLSRIYYLRKFFNYPISLNMETLKNLGIVNSIGIMVSYMKAQLFPIKNEVSLEDFIINRFGNKLYRTFFKDYTEKVWGVECHKISKEWGAQRIKGLSITKVLLNAMQSAFKSNKKGGDIYQKNKETSLIEKFLYPKFGPGQLWETVAETIVKQGGELHKNFKVKELIVEGNKITGVVAENNSTKEIKEFKGDYFFSTMPVVDLIKSLKTSIPADVQAISDGLMYRDFITVGLLLSELKIKNKDKSAVKDNWIYIQESDVKIGRLQIFNNWSPYMVADKTKSWIGLEYFCNEGDELWSMTDKDFLEFAKMELAKIDIISLKEVLDGVVIRVPKTYPAYFGTYDQFDVIRNFTDKIENLFLVGRNGMHKYNNQDHSMLTAMTAVENIINKRTDKANIWDINTEQEYHESK